MDITTWFFVLRGTERLCIIISGSICLYLGYRLFIKSIMNDQTASIETKNWRIHLKRVGPGIFFALFGAAILIFAINSRVDIEKIREISDANRKFEKVTTSMFFDTNRAVENVQAINTIENISQKNVSDDITPADLGDLKQASNILSLDRDEVLIQHIGTNSMTMWKEKGIIYLTEPYKLKPETRDELKSIKKWYDDVTGY